MKEQNKTPEKELNEMEISNLLDAQFKTLVIRLLQEFIGYFNSIEKTLAEMKVKLSEIRKNLQGTNGGENKPENQINDLEHKEGKSIQSVQQRGEKKESPQNEDKPMNPWDIFNVPTCGSWVCRKEKRKSKKLKTYLKK